MDKHLPRMCLKALTASVITQVKNHRKHFNIGNFHPPYFFVHNKGTCMYLYLFFMQKYDTFCEWVLNKPNIEAHFVPVLFLRKKGSYFVENVLESIVRGQLSTFGGPVGISWTRRFFYGILLIEICWIF